ncbi:MAG: hypothetical protein WC683_06125 [bacterium]
MRTAIVGGWGAVERLAKIWDPAATVEEIEIRLWVVRVEGRPIGMIGKEPWTAEGVRSRAEEEDCT